MTVDDIQTLSGMQCSMAVLVVRKVDGGRGVGLRMVSSGYSGFLHKKTDFTVSHFIGLNPNKPNQPTHRTGKFRVLWPRAYATDNTHAADYSRHTAYYRALCPNDPSILCAENSPHKSLIKLNYSTMEHS